VYQAHHEHELWLIAIGKVTYQLGDHVKVHFLLRGFMREFVANKAKFLLLDSCHAWAGCDRPF
jgi:hypothetical protein